MFIFHIHVPRGASAIEADLSYLAPTQGGNFTAGPSQQKTKGARRSTTSRAASTAATAKSRS
jgi:hypothetical protein